MQTIITKYHAATNTRPARFSAQASGWGKRIYLSAESCDGHDDACRQLQRRLKVEAPHGLWDKPMVGGQLANGDHVWVFDEPGSPRTAPRPVFDQLTLAEACLALLPVIDDAGPRDIKGAQTVLRGYVTDVRNSRAKRKYAAVLVAALNEVK